MVGAFVVGAWVGEVGVRVGDLVGVSLGAVVVGVFVVGAWVRSVGVRVGDLVGISVGPVGAVVVGALVGKTVGENETR